VSAWAIALTAFACIVAGVLLGAFLRSLLPKAHLAEESRDMVKVALGLIGTLAALVLGLLVASANSAFNMKVQEVQQAAARIILIDHNLRQYGSSANEAREFLRQSMTAAVSRAWSNDNASGGDVGTSLGLPAAAAIEDFQHKLRTLSPTTEEQSLLRARLLQLSQDLAQTRWLLVEQSGSSIPMPFLVVLVFWLATIFTGFGLLSPPHSTLMTIKIFCALSVASAIFLVLEMDRPFDGLFRISDAPLRSAVNQMVR
jgi:hypothetical protein